MDFSKSTVVVRHRCVFNGSSSDVKSGWFADCVVCKSRRLYAKAMVECELCHLLVHKQCAVGAALVDSTRPAVLAVVSTQTDRVAVRDVACGSGHEPSARAAETGTQTGRVAVRDVACGSGDEPSSRAAETGTQTGRVAVRDVACGSGDEPSARAAETGTQTGRVAVRDFACGSGDGPSVRAAETGTQTGRVAAVQDFARGSGDGPSARAAETGTQTERVTAVRDVACGSDAECAVIACREVESAAPKPTTASANTKNITAVQPQPSTQSQTLRYWKKRYALFSKFDEGIQLDEMSFYSACPEVLAHHMAVRRCAFHTVLDPFCGAGSNAIQLALTCRKVIAIDVDPAKISMARKNAEIYGVADRIDFRTGDSFKIAPGIRVDAIVTSPPWRGPWYTAQPKYDARDLCGRHVGGMAAILRLAARVVTTRVLLHVPKNIYLAQCSRLARENGFNINEFENVSIDGRPNALIIHLIQRDRNATTRGSPPPPKPFVTKVVNLETRPMSQQQRSIYLRTNDIASYRKYLKNVDGYFS